MYPVLFEFIRHLLFVHRISLSRVKRLQVMAFVLLVKQFGLIPTMLLLDTCVLDEVKQMWEDVMMPLAEILLEIL